MHQVHAEGQLGEGSDQGGRLFLPYAGENQEESERSEKDVGGAELPGPFDYRRGDGLSRDSLHPEGPAREDGADDEAEPSYGEFLAAGPVEMVADIMSHHEIPQIPGEIP